MSESSCSFHLRSDNEQECIDMLKKSKIKGYVFPADNNWVTFVCEGDSITINKLLKSNRGTLVNYVFAEDFGWSFSIFQAEKEICSYECRWGGPVFDEYGEIVIDENGESEIDGILVDDKMLRSNVLLELLNNDFSKMNRLKEVLSPTSISEVVETSPAYLFCEILGFKNYDWLSFEDIHHYLKDNKRIIEV